MRIHANAEDVTDLGPMHGLLAAIILQALKDAQDGRPCDGRCRPPVHECRRGALRFLRSPRCASLLAWLDLPEDLQADLVAQARNEKGSKAHRTLKTE